MSSLVYTDYGTDITIGKVVSTVSGTRNLLNALVRRLKTPRGGLFYDPGYGEDVTAYLNRVVDADMLDQIKVNVEQQMLLDDRVSNVDAIVTYNQNTFSLKLTISVTPIVGETFTLVLSVDKLSVKILEDSLRAV